MSAATRRRPWPVRVPLVILILLAGTAVGVPRAAASGGPLRVFILAGQSNMQGHAEVRTLDTLALDADGAALLATLRGEDGGPRVCDRTHLSSLGSSDEIRTGPLTAGFGAGGRRPKFGPELGFGTTMEDRLDGPILIIKTAWGGKSLHTDFRPPSAGPSTLPDAQVRRLTERGEDVDAARTARTEASGHFYRLMMEHVRAVLADPGAVHPDFDPEQGIELAGFVWFQGWNDMVDGGAYPERNRPGGYDAYADLLATFIQDVRRDLEAPELPFVIGVMGVGGPLDSYGPEQLRYRDVHGRFRAAMAEPASRPEFAGTVVAVETAPFWDVELVGLRSRDRQIAAAVQAEVEAGDRPAEEAPADVARRRAAAFTARELVLLDESTSNADYHYMGSARIMAPIGRAFAEAMLALMEDAP